MLPSVRPRPFAFNGASHYPRVISRYKLGAV